MDELEARTQAELEAILSILTRLTGLTSRWFIAALETLRAVDQENDPFGRSQREFYLDMLAIPIRDRPGSILRSILALEPLQSNLFVSTFSRANSILKLRTT